MALGEIHCGGIMLRNLRGEDGQETGDQNQDDADIKFRFEAFHPSLTLGFAAA